MQGAQQLLGQRATDDGDRVAFAHGDAGSTVLWSDVARHASEWLEHMAAPTDRGPRLVGLVLNEPTTFCSAYLAALATGTPIAPLPPHATADELAERASVLALTDVIGDRLDAPQAAVFADAGARVWTIEAGQLHLVAESDEPWTRATEATATSVVLSTSGSSGRPKLVPLSERQLLHVAREVAAHHRLGRDDRGYCPLPLFHVNAQVVGVLATLVSGGSLVVEERFSRDRFWDVAQSFDVTWLNLVPAILANLAVPSAAGVSPGGGIRFARSASSPLSEAVRERFESAHGIGVLETYGMTEAASQITANPLRAEDRRSGSVGLPVGIELRVVDLDGDPVHDGATGVVQIRGPGVVGRYLAPGRIGATPACGIDGWFSTGDLGHRDRDGFVYLVGRTDDVINRGGEKVYPREIEEVLLRDRRVSEAVATARAHPSLGEQPVAYVTTALPADARAGLANDLQRSCELALSRYKRPAEIFVIDTLPVGATGKVARRRLAERSLVGGKP